MRTSLQLSTERGACIDIGSNTTRLAVIEPRKNGLQEVLTQRSFTRINKNLGPERRLSQEKIDEVAAVVATQAQLARRVGAGKIAVVGTAAVRKAANAGDLCEAVKDRAGLALRVVSGEEEAALAFLGTIASLEPDVLGPIAVVDVGGSSTEIAVGTRADGVLWSRSFDLGSGTLADTYLAGDPPRAPELEAIRAHLEALVEPLRLDVPGSAVAVGGSATSLRRLVGVELEASSLDRALEILTSASVAEVSRRFELEPERTRLLPAGALLLKLFSVSLGAPLRVGRGGVREGAIVELLTNGRDAPLALGEKSARSALRSRV